MVNIFQYNDVFGKLFPVIKATALWKLVYPVKNPSSTPALKQKTPTQIHV
jgi:hypothetical protein